MDIGNRIGNPCFFESFQSQLATVTKTTGAMIGHRIIATPRQAVFDSQFHAFGNDFALGHVKQGGVYFHTASAFDSRLGGEIGHPFIRLNIFLPTIGVTAVVELIGAKKNIFGLDPFRQCQCERKKYSVPRRNISNGNAVGYFGGVAAFGNIDVVG